METIEEFEAFVRDRVVDLHMGCLLYTSRCV